MIKNLGRKMMALSFLCGTLLFATGQAVAVDTYKITVAATFPKGFAGAVSVPSRPSNTKFTPCLENATTTALMDGVIFTVTYDAGKKSPDSRRNVYLILYNPEGDPLQGGSPYYTISRPSLGGSSQIPVLTKYKDVNDLNTPKSTTTGAIFETYLKAEENPGTGAITEQIFGGVINLRGVTSGTWQMVGIIAKENPEANLDFNNRDTWEAWDVATLVVGKPWASADQLAKGKDVCADLVK